MPKITIDPSDVTDLKTPLYKKDDNQVYRLLPETMADQVALPSGENVETKISSLESNISVVSNSANNAKNTADAVKAQVDDAATGLAATKAIADSAKATAEQAADDIDTLNTSLASLEDNVTEIGETADSALTIANQAKDAAVVMEGASTTADGKQGLVPKPLKGIIERYLRADGSWAPVVANGVEVGNVGDIDADTLTETGVYEFWNNTNWQANHWPPAIGAFYRIAEVWHTPLGRIWQLVVSTSLVACRVKNVSGAADWSKWEPIYIKATTNVNIWISKSGDDNNFGLTADSPVLTVNRALQIADACTIAYDNTAIVLHFGEGNWGNVTIRQKKNTFLFTNYSSTRVNEYSEDLPVFNNLTSNGCFIWLRSIVVNKVSVVDGTGYCYVERGYKRIGSVLAEAYGTILFAYNTDASNIWEIKNHVATTPIIHVTDGGRISLPGVRLKLGENITDRFIYMQNGSVQVNKGYSVFEETEFSISGDKLKTDLQNNSIGTGEEPGVLDWFDSVPGDGALDISDQTIVNGLSNAAVSKTGDKLTGGLTFNTQGTAGTPITYNTDGINLTNTPTTNIHRALGVINDANNNRVGTVRLTQHPDSSISLNLIAHNLVGSATLDVRIFPDGSKRTTFPTPDLSSIGDIGATCGWVNSKLGTGASTIALAALDETEEGYVETLETKKLKIIDKINAEASQAILAGFPYEIDGQEYRIGYGFFDQENINGDAILAMGNPGKVMALRCMDETGQTVWLDVPTETVLAIHKYGIVSHRDEIRKAADEKKARIMAADTEAEIQSIFME